MKKIFTLILSLTATFAAYSQTTIGNGGFETWDNASSSTAEPTDWNSNKTGTGLASSGPQTCYQETAGVFAGTSCVRVETKYYIIAVVNGNVTTGQVNAPSSNKSEGYLSATGANKMAFTGRPDSLIGYYKYTQATSGTGASAEQAKVRAILHSGDYFDPETPFNGNHADLSANKIGDALFVSPAANQSSWKRFSVPFVYVNGTTPSYIMVNATSSNNQLTTAPGMTGTGSKLWLDGVDVIYNTPTGLKEVEKSSFMVYCFEKNLFVDFTKKDDKNAIINIYDLTGKLILTQALDNNKKNSIQLPSSVNNGIYLYQINGASTQKMGKFIVE
jgi:hypothetical protein